ncbi:MAG: phasin family protein [Nitrospirae bacterium]|nr:phasin family protein [Nitrospirota bacterium]
MAAKTHPAKAHAEKQTHSVSHTRQSGADFLFAPVGAYLTLRDRGTEIFSGLVDKGRKAEPRIRREVAKVRERVEGLDLKVPEWVRIRLESTSQRARKTWEDLNLPETLKNLEVRDRVEKLRTRIQGLVR